MSVRCASLLHGQLSFMGLNRLGDGGDDQPDGRVVDGYLSLAAWQRLARRAECCPLFISCVCMCQQILTEVNYLWLHTHTHTPVVHLIRNGAFHVKPPPKTRTQQERKDPSKEVIEIKPPQVNRESD